MSSTDRPNNRVGLSPKESVPMVRNPIGLARQPNKPKPTGGTP